MSDLVTDLGAWLDDQPRLANRFTVPVLMSTDHAVDIILATRKVDVAERAVKAASGGPDMLATPPDLAAARERLAEAQADLEAAEQAAEPHMVDFVVESVGADTWEMLEGAHPPSDQDIQRDGKDALWNARTFPLAAIAYCLRAPAEVPAAELDRYTDAIMADDALPDLPTAAKLKAKVPGAVWDQLFNAVVRVNRGVNPVPKSWGGSAGTPHSANGSEPRSS